MLLLTTASHIGGLRQSSYTCQHTIADPALIREVDEKCGTSDTQDVGLELQTRFFGPTSPSPSLPCGACGCGEWRQQRRRTRSTLHRSALLSNNVGCEVMAGANSHGRAGEAESADGIWPLALDSLAQSCGIVRRLGRWAVLACSDSYCHSSCACGSVLRRSIPSSSGCRVAFGHWQCVAKGGICRRVDCRRHMYMGFHFMSRTFIDLSCYYTTEQYFISRLRCFSVRDSYNHGFRYTRMQPHGDCARHGMDFRRRPWHTANNQQALLRDQSDVPDELAGVSRAGLKHGTGRFSHILLVPQPSDSPNDP